MVKIKKKEIERIVLEEGMIVEDVIDVVIKLNGLVGVGLVSLGDKLRDYCMAQIGKGKHRLPYGDE